MKNTIKKFVQTITHKRTSDLFHENVVDISREGDHVVFWVDNAGPRRELSHGKHDQQIKKAVDAVCGEQCTYEVRLVRPNGRHERSGHVMRQSLRV